MKLSIIIPAYNEEATIGRVITSLKLLKLPKKVTKEIIVSDDGSTDKTFKIVKKFKGVKLIRKTNNSGKGFAVKLGVDSAEGDIILIQDADLEYNPASIPKLLEPVVNGKAEVVYGTRLKNYPLRLSGSRKTPLITHFLGNKLLSSITSLLYGRKVTDMETGYKLFRKSVLEGIKLNSRRFDIEPEITAKILKKGYKIYEVPIRTIPRGYDEGKKITWRDGFVALWTLIKYRFVD